MDAFERPEGYRIVDTVEFLEKNPKATQAAVVKKFGVSRYKLRRRLSNIGPPGGLHAQNARLTEDEEIGLYKHIIHLNQLNLSIRPELLSPSTQV